MAERGIAAGRAHPAKLPPQGGLTFEELRASYDRAERAFPTPPGPTGAPRNACGTNYFSRGSSASRRPSPKRLKPSTLMKMARPGKSDSHGFSWMKGTFTFRSQPQLGV